MGSSLETRALSYKLVSVGFLYPEKLWKERMSALIEEFNQADSSIEPKEIKDISVFLSKDDSLEELQREHFRLFGPDPLCPLEITHWTKNGVFMQSRQMADIAGFYRAFGLDIDEGVRVDNFSVAFEFLSYLSIKTLHASEEGNDNHIKITESAMDKFRNEFVLPALKRFIKSVKTNSKARFYEAIGGLALKTNGGG